MRYILNLGYDGSAFCGWQIQPEVPTVQGSIESALETLLRARTPVTGAGRTDTGVHALSYTAHFDSDAPLDTEELCYKLNSILPAGISVYSVLPAGEQFHARFDAVRRDYSYFIHTHKDPFVSGYSFLYTYPLDFEAMNRAAGKLLGRHDFSCFEKVGADNRTSVCTVYEAGWSEYTPVVGAPGKHYVFRIAADRFLRNMVRAIVGTLLDVGRGRRTVEEFALLVESPQSAAVSGKVARCAAGESVPGNALFLTGVKY